VVAAVVSLVAFALSEPGYAVHHAELNDGGVWASYDGGGSIGRFNKPINQLDGRVYALGGAQASYNLDVLQEGVAVVGEDLAKGQIYPLDAAGLTANKDSVLSLPGNAVVAMGGGVLAVLDPAKGSLWAMTFNPEQVLTSIAALDSSATPLAHVGAGSTMTVGQDGTVYTASADKGLTRIAVAPTGAFAAPVTSPLAGVTGRLTITVVGTLPVGLATHDGSQDATVGVNGGTEIPVPGGSTAVLQQPGPATSDVLLATPSALLAVPMDGGKPRSISSAGTGQAPAAPIQFGGCLAAAWAGAPGSYVASCGGRPATAKPIKEASTRLVFRMNRNQMILNDPVNGDIWNLDSGTPHQVANWTQITPPQEQKNDPRKNNNENTDASHPLPPEAHDDEFGARPGRMTALYVLDNDNDPSGGVLAVDSVSAAGDVQSWLSIAPDGQTVDITLPANTTADTVFKYVVRDDKGGTASATVTVHARGPGEHADPTLRTGFQPHDWSVPAGGTVSIPVVSDWRDYADGDPVVLTAATVKAGAVTTTADGELVYTAPATAGDQQIAYQVGTGAGGTAKGTLTVHVQGVADKPVAATAEPDVARGEVDKPIVVHPLANDLPGSDPLSPTATMKLAGAVASPAGTEVTTDLAAGTVTIIAHHAGTFSLGYQVAYGNAPFGSSTIRVDVVPASTPRPPITSPTIAVLHGQAPATVDVLANDFAPSGNLLVVQHAAAADPSQLQVAIIGGQWLRINALTPRLSPSTQIVTYTVTDGVTGPVNGEVSVTQLPMPADDTPVPLADYATVRAGDSVVVPVLDNDISPAGDALSLVKDVPGAPAPGQLTVTPKLGAAYVSGNLVRYLAPPADNVPTATQVTIDYYVQNTAGQQARGQARVVITPPVSATNADQPPAPQPIEARTVAGDTVTIKVPTSGIDPDGDSVVVTGIGSAPTLGRIMGFGATSIQYQAYPNADNGGTDSFTYVVTDTQGKSASSTVRVAIVPPGDPQAPVAVDDSVTVAPGATVRVDVLANDLIAPDDRVTIAKLSDSNPDLAAGISLASPTGPIVVKAGDDPKHPVVVLYRITDGLNSSTAALTVRTQAGVNIPPVAFDQFAQPKPGADQVSVDLLKGDYDPDSSDPLTVVSPTSGVSGSSLTVKLAKHPQAIPYVIKDGGGATAMAVVYVPAAGAGAPYAKPGASITIPVGGKQKISVSDYVIDPAGKPLRTTTADTISASPAAGLGVASGGDATHLDLTALGAFAGPAAITFQVTDGSSLADPAAQSAYVTIPVQVGDVTPVLRCPSSVIQVVEGGKAVPIDVASVCHVWMPNPADVASLRFTGSWKTQPGNVSLSGSDSAVLSVKAGGAAQPGATGVITVGVAGSKAVPQTLQLAVVKAPPLTLTPIDIDGIKAGESKTLDIAGYASSRLGDPVISVIGKPVETSGMPATISASGAKVTVTPGNDSHGTVTFSITVTDVADASRADRQVTGQITLNVLGHPDAPTNVAPGLTVQSHVVDVSWTAPANNGAPIDNYTVNYGSGTQNCPASPCTITGLTNGKPYTFVVSAHNVAGDGPPSAASAAATPDAVPPAVTGFTTSNPQDGQLTLAWNVDVPDGTPIQKYQISWPGAAAPAVVAASATTYTATGLDNSNPTTFTIIAFNRQGPSPQTTTTGQSAGKPATPAAPRLSVTTDTATNSRVVVLNWDADQPNGPSPTTYTVTRTSGGGSKTLCPNTTATTCTDSGITLDGTQYTYTLVAANATAATDPAPHTSAASPGSVMEAAATPDPITNIATHVVSSTPDGQAPVTFTVGASHGKTSTVTCAYGGAGCFGPATYPIGGQAASATLSFPAGYSGSFTLSDCNGSTGNASQFSGASCTTSAAVGVSVNAPPSQPGGGSCGLSGNTVIFNWSASRAYGARTLSYYALSNATGGQTGATSASVGEPADGGQSTLTVVAVDSNGEQSAANSYTCGHAPPPQPAVTASRGNSTSNCGPGVANCYFLNSSVSNFTPGRYNYQCLATVKGQITQFTGGSFTVNVPADGNVGPYCWGQSGYQMPYYVQINGVMSNPISW
jgi:hypothetical protein